MAGFDLTIFDNGIGGDIVLDTNDLSMTSSLYNQVYLALFGGNLSQSHIDSEDAQNGEQRLDYWQNKLLLSDDESNKMVSGTEIALSKLSMTSQGLYDLKNIIQEDLDFLKSFGDVTINIELITNNFIKLLVSIKSRENEQDHTFKFIWDSTSKELVSTVNV